MPGTPFDIAAAFAANFRNVCGFFDFHSVGCFVGFVCHCSPLVFGYGFVGHNIRQTNNLQFSAVRDSAPDDFPQFERHGLPDFNRQPFLRYALFEHDAPSQQA